LCEKRDIQELAEVALSMDLTNPFLLRFLFSIKLKNKQIIDNNCLNVIFFVIKIREIEEKKEIKSSN